MSEQTLDAPRELSSHDVTCEGSAGVVWKRRFLGQQAQRFPRERSSALSRWPTS
jgi:hypothetical protein